MTTIFENIQAGRPQTHVFIIGVGKYPYLVGGEGSTLDNPMGLRQLTSPSISAKAFADWIIKKLGNPHAPLGSVELLLSPAADYLSQIDHQQFQVKAATMGNIKTAFDEWYKRCNLHKDNVAIFYFCGHGLEKVVEHPLLLAEDFGKTPIRLWENAVDFHLTYLGMGSCQAKVQCYFIDSCRQTPSEIREIQEISATALVHPSLFQKNREVLKLFATDTNQTAYGLSNTVTRFTDALINCFNGLGSEKQSGQWVVKTGKLASSLTKILEKSNQEPNTPQQKPVRFGSGSSILHVCDTEPSVPVAISLNPTEASNFAELLLLKEETVKYTPQLDSKSKKWKANVLADMYRCRTHFPQREYRNLDNFEIWALPPYSEEEIEVIRVEESVIV
jgi:hypothetical protein